MDRLASQDGCAPRSAFLAEITTREGPLLVERRVVPCNLEVRIKRYHIGSPLHRYRYTERYPSTQSCGPVGRWSRFDTPVVCFDWRHPLYDDQGQRLADEPISDDYAQIWMEDVGYAKAAARQTFIWLERLFERAELRLVDMCLIIDRSGRTIYGEISPDCMRVRLDLSDPALSPAGAKDVWRAGGSAEALLHNYQECYRRLFGEA
jgi:phosphoribosylaminoimidazole-succinocarboxamide synthase